MSDHALLNIVIRADAESQMGTGHVMRCLALASALREYGHQCSFVSRDVPGHLFRVIEDMRFPVRPLPGNTSTEEDAARTIAALEGESPDWIIVDHYQLDIRWECEMRASARRILVIDDLADREHDCDILLDQNLYADMHTRYAGLVPASCVQLLGPQHALLRAEFGAARARQRSRDGKIGRILVFFGGSDPTGETLKVLRVLRRQEFFGCDVDVVVGASNPRRDEIEAECLHVPRFTFHCQVRNMAELMSVADLAIGAGGTASWERACLGLPAIVVSVADNQDAVAKALDETGVIQFLGTSLQVTEESIAQSLRQLLRDDTAVLRMAKRALRLTDGEGAWRVAATLGDVSAGSATIVLRVAQAHEESQLHAWRNAPHVRETSFDNRPIPLDEHRRWYRAVLENPERHLLIAEVRGEPVGVLRYDVAQDESEVSIYLLAGRTGKGYGAGLLRAGSAWLKKNAPQVRRIRARILASNVASRKAFAKAGYVASGDDFVFDLGLDG